MAHVLTGSEYPRDALYEAWDLLLVNQQHDILPGSITREPEEDAVRDYARVQELAATITGDATRAIADRVDTGGDALVVFNPVSWRRDGIVEVDAGAIPDGARLVDLEGRAVPQQVTGDGRLLVQVSGVPSCGYTTLRIEQGETACESSLTVSETTMENRFFRLELDEKGPDRVPVRQADGQAGAGAGLGRQRAAAVRGPAPQLRRMGHRPLLRGQGVGDRRRRVGARDRDRARPRHRRDHAPLLPLLDRAAPAHLRLHPANRLPHRGRLARDPHPAQGRLPRRRQRLPRHLRDPVRRHRPPDPPQHLVGPGPVRGLRPEVGRPVRGRLRRIAPERLQVRLRRRGQCDAHQPPALADQARPADRPGQPRVHLQPHASLRRLAERLHPRRLRAQLPHDGREGHGRRLTLRQTCPRRCPSSPRTAKACS